MPFELEDDWLDRLAGLAERNSQIDEELYDRFDVKRGLRERTGRGVLAGLTHVGDVRAYELRDGEPVPTDGHLIYRGYDLDDIVHGFLDEDRFGFEEVCYLLLFGELPNDEELDRFQELLDSYRTMPPGFVHNAILDMPGRDIMNSISRAILALYTYDDEAEDTSLRNVMLQCMHLVAAFPLLLTYAYQAHAHRHKRRSLVIHSPVPGLSVAENLLHMLRHDSEYTPLEARLLDLALVVHAEHGGGNNSTFVTHVVTSSGTDTYSTMAAALASLKGPKHGGANIRVLRMFEDLKQHVPDWSDDAMIEDYLHRLAQGEAFDRSGLIYGMGHAVYSVSDPRSEILKTQVKRLAREKGLEDEYQLYERVERIAPEVIAKVHRVYKGVSANVDFYSGFLYRLLEIPPELYTPLFAMARIAGWSAHRIEEVANGGKMIRPAYKSVAMERDYLSMAERDENRAAKRSVRPPSDGGWPTSD
jgi:citrate synthase